MFTPPASRLSLLFNLCPSVKSCFQNMDICKRRCSAFDNGKNLFGSNNGPSAATNLTVTFSSQLNQHSQVSPSVVSGLLSPNDVADMCVCSFVCKYGLNIFFFLVFCKVKCKNFGELVKEQQHPVVTV